MVPKWVPGGKSNRVLRLEKAVKKPWFSHVEPQKAKRNQRVAEESLLGSEGIHLGSKFHFFFVLKTRRKKRKKGKIIPKGFWKTAEKGNLEPFGFLTMFLG